MNEEKNQRALAVILVILVLALGVYKIFFSKDNKESKIDTKSITIVKNNNDFYTVAGCIDKYYVYLNSYEVDNLLILLDEEYKKDNNINSSNLSSYIKKLDEFSSFIPEKMYVQRLSKDKYKYYVSGLIEEGTEYSLRGYDKGYLIVTLDRSNLTFSVQPYDGEIFKK